MTANALHRAALHERTKKYAMDLTLAYDTTLEGWAHALELRDQETEGHSRHVVQLTVDLARAMGAAEDEMEHIRRGALLHDVGKMGIPDSVLLKPGTLNDREWEIMRRHPEYAYQLLQPIEYLRPVIDIPYCHHEKWDGSGYPRGLKGEEIPLAARIFAIVDVWDALLTDRPYRKAWTVDKARSYLTEQSGLHFDPKVVQSFLEMIAKK
jgi:putative nucleotidyltransferase with HDIG domain